MNEQNNSIYTLINEEEKNIGNVISALDGYIIVDGLYSVFIGEKVIVNYAIIGIVFEIGPDYTIIFLLEQTTVPIGSKVERTHTPYSIAVSEDMLGSVLNIFGEKIDESSSDKKTNTISLPIEREIPGITARKPIDTPLPTGFLLIDSLIPIGKGQRQLFIGNQNTGKTYTAINTFLRNKNDDNIICIYVSIGQQQIKTAKIRDYLSQYKTLEKTIIINSSAGEPAVNNYLAPYVGITIAEYFAHTKKKDVIIVYDDLSNQAIAYRQLCLLMKRAPSRDAYPGDVFYLHARLLERAGNFSEGGSITAIPIAQLQENDLSGYIPTNLISITDGQTIFDSKLFNKGHKPAINTELSVSRVGGAAQYENIKKISKSLKLELAQYQELELFSQFTSDLDKKTIDILDKGKLLVTLLKQDIKTIYQTSDIFLILFLYKYYSASLKSINNIPLFLTWLTNFFSYKNEQIKSKIEMGHELNELEKQELKNFLENCFTYYATM